MERLKDLLSTVLSNNLIEPVTPDDHIQLYKDFNNYLGANETPAVYIIHHIEKENFLKHYEWNKKEYLEKYSYASNSDFLNWYINGINSVLSFDYYDTTLEEFYENEKFKVDSHHYPWGDEYSAYEKQYDQEFIKHYLKFISDYVEGLKAENKRVINEDLKVVDVLPSIELESIKEQVRLLYDLGVVDFLIDKYPTSFKNIAELSRVLSTVLDKNQQAVYSPLNALISNNTGKNFPSQSPKIKALIDTLNAAEQL